MASDSPRPPQPISPMLMRSLAPITRPLALLELLAAAIALVAADSAPTDFRKFLRSTESLDMNAPSYSPLNLNSFPEFLQATSEVIKLARRSPRPACGTCLHAIGPAGVMS